MINNLSNLSHSGADSVLLNDVDKEQVKYGKKYNIGIVGYGVIGSALGEWIKENNPSCTLLISDPPKNLNDNLDSCDIIFISIHIPTENDGTQNLEELENILKKLPNVPIYIRTTLLPGTCDKLSLKLNKQIFFMPEFLTERTALEDFKKQSMIFTGNINLLKEIFPNKIYVEMNNIEAEITKYAHNVFGAVKVTYFNGIYDICQKLGIDFQNVQKGVLLSGYINETHTFVPGPDGKLGYGGKCFPKDVNAFKESMKEYPISKMINVTNELNNEFRKEKL